RRSNRSWGSTSTRRSPGGTASFGSERPLVNFHLQIDLSVEAGQCSMTPPRFTGARPVSDKALKPLPYLARNLKIESTPLQRRVYKLSVPKRRSEDRREAVADRNRLRRRVVRKRNSHRRGAQAPRRAQSLALESKKQRRLGKAVWLVNRYCRTVSD